MRRAGIAILALAAMAYAVPAHASSCPPFNPATGLWIFGEVSHVSSRTSVDDEGTSHTVSEADLHVGEAFGAEVAGTMKVRSLALENLTRMMVSGHRLEDGPALLGGKIADDGAFEVAGCSGFNGASAPEPLARLRSAR